MSLSVCLKGSGQKRVYPLGYLRCLVYLSHFIPDNQIESENDEVLIGEPVLTRYERARIIGARALQIAHGAPILIATDETDFRPIDVSTKELKARVLPIGLARKLPNSKFQIIPVQWLKDREFISQIDMEY